MTGAPLMKLVALIYGGKPTAVLMDGEGGATVLYGAVLPSPTMGEFVSYAADYHPDVSLYDIIVRNTPGGSIATEARYDVQYTSGKMRAIRTWKRADVAELEEMTGIEAVTFSLGSPHDGDGDTLAIIGSDRRLAIIETAKSRVFKEGAYRRVITHRFVLSQLIAFPPATYGWLRWRSYIPGMNMRMVRATMAL